jgi:hypothetical protein
MIDHSKPWTAYCTSPKFARIAGQRILAKDGSVIVVVGVTKPKYTEDQMRWKYTYTTRPATAEEAAEFLAANAEAASKKEAATRAALQADDERHA